MNSWLQIFEKTTYQYLSAPKLMVPFLARQMGLSERQLYRKVKSLTGQTPNRYIQQCRMTKAKELLLLGHFGTVKEVASAVGFTDAKYFSQLFEKHFGHRPGEILVQKKFGRKTYYQK